MSGFVIDRKDLNESFHFLRYSLAHAYNASDYGDRARCFIQAQTTYHVLDLLGLMNESQKINYKADLTELESLI